MLAQLCLKLSAAGRGEGPHPARLIHALPYEALVGAGPVGKQGQALAPRDVPGHRLPCCGVKVGGTPIPQLPMGHAGMEVGVQHPGSIDATCVQVTQ